MRKHLLSSLVVFLVVTVLAGCAPAPAARPAPAAPAAPQPAAPAAPVAPKPAAPAATAPKETVIKLIAASVGGSAWNWFTAQAFLASKHSTWLKADVLPSKGYAESLYFLLEGKGEVISTAPHLVARAVKGEGEYKTLGPRSDTRYVTALSVIYMNVMVLDKSPVKAFTYDDLKGKTIAMLTPGSLSADISLFYLRAAGLDPKKDVRVLNMKTSDCVSALLDGTADVYMHVTGIPFSPVEELFATKPSRLIPVPPELTKKANDLSGAGLPVATFPANLYKGQTQPVVTSSTPAISVTRENVREDIIYELTRLWWDFMDERNELHPEIARQATVDMLKSVQAASGIPYHNGALKYYREKGWVK